MTHTIDLTHPDLSLQSGHLKMGGRNPAGLEINANSRYLTLGGQPWLPVMGEFHFSRYPNAFWREELLKMKAGGISIVATYIFWIHHEEIDGDWDWSVDRDLRRFIQLCAELGLYAYPRIGPWAHGECRNGGFPDWLLEKCGDQVRQDTPLYLSYVRRLYDQIARRLDGLLWKDGGPVIGIQLENELIQNADHILTLKHLAQEAGIYVPLYTMTGWGPAAVPQDEVIPLFGGYPDAFWNRDISGWARECRKQYLFSSIRNDDLIGADLLRRPGMVDISYLDRYPFATCELGGGMQVSYHRRPYIQPDDVAAPPVCKLGSGSNLPGYYMYHGGSHPLGKRSTMQETQATGYWNDLPVISYDFQAAVREYGQLNGQYHRLRLLHLFLQDFGAQLAPLPPHFPQSMPTSLDDRETLRWSARSDGRSGFLFINNYQRVEALQQKTGVQFELMLKEEILRLPSAPVDIPGGAYMIWPFNLELNGLTLRYATAQPVCLLQDSGVPCYVFAARGGIAAEFCFDPDDLTFVTGASVDAHGLLNDVEAGKPVTLIGEDGPRARLLLLDQRQALQCWKASIWEGERLLLSPAGLLIDGDTLSLRAEDPADLWFSVYPAPAHAGQGLADGAFTRYTFSAAEKSITVSARQIQAAGPARVVPIGAQGVAQQPEDADFNLAEMWEVRLPPHALEGVADILLRIDYAGDAARAYLGGRLMADDFYNGRTWEIGLKRFAPQVLEQGLTLKFLPLRQDAPIYIAPEHRPAFDSSGEALQVRGITAAAVYEIEVKLEDLF